MRGEPARTILEIAPAEILDSLAEAVTIRDPHNHIVWANRAALAHLGFSSIEDLQSRSPHSIFDDYIVTDEHGRELTMDDIPSVRLLGGREAEPLVLRTINRTTGEVHWDLLKASPLHDEHGKPFAAVTIIEDITRQRMADLRDRFLAQVSETLMSSLDYEQTLRNVAWLAVPEIADWCAVDLVEAGGERRQVVVAHRDPAKLALAEELRRFEPGEDLRADRGLGRVLRSGETELWPEVNDEMLAEAATSEEHLRLLRTVGFRSVLLAPLSARGKVFGVMTLVTAESLRRFGEEDKELATQMAGRAAVAVENSRLATARRQTAITLQRGLLPDRVPEIEGWSAAAMYRAASGSEEVEVGGDFYDFIPGADGWMLVLGDVTGKGVEAAALTSLVRHGARFLSKYERSPSRILHRLNEALREQPELMLCTTLCIRLDPEGLVLSSAGHPLPLVIRDDGEVRELGATGPILGAWSEQERVDQSAALGVDETLFMYTDGVVDVRGERDRFGMRRLREVLHESAGRSPEEILSALETALDRFQIGAQADDTAAVALRPVRVAGYESASVSGGPGSAGLSSDAGVSSSSHQPTSRHAPAFHPIRR